MVEIIVGVWLASFLLSAMVTGINIWSVLQAAKSPQIRILNSNLGKIGMFWSQSSESIQPLAKGTPHEDVKKMVRNYLLFGGLGFFSFIGFGILLVVSLSMRFLSSRDAKRILNSELTVSQDLNEELIKAIAQDYLPASAEGSL